MSQFAPHQHDPGLSRRAMLRAGGLGLFGLTWADVLRLQAGASEPVAQKPAKRPMAVILAFCPGAPSHIDTWDPKPDAPVQIRGEFGTIATKTPGLRVGEHLRLLAARSDRYTLIRSMTHGQREHEPGTHVMLAGLSKPPPDSSERANRTSDWPNMGSVLTLERPSSPDLPTAVVLPTKLTFAGYSFPGQNAGFLGPQYDPWHLEGDPNSPDFRPEALELAEGLNLTRINSRGHLLQEVDHQRRALETQATTKSIDGLRQKAISLLASSKARDAFDLAKEDPKLRDRYGRTLMGQSLLLARRLVEAGVGLVQANMGPMNHWDTHNDNFSTLKNTLLPPYDQAVSALLDDLYDRGLTDDVLVIVTGEFGRTPKVGQQTTVANATKSGRDHWGGVFTTLVSGGGLKVGQVIGASDRIGGFPASVGFTPADLAATVYHQLGINRAQEVHDMLGRTFRLNSGTPIEALLA